MCSLERSGDRLGRAGAVPPTGQQARFHKGRHPLCRAPLLPLGQRSPGKTKGVSAGRGQGKGARGRVSVEQPGLPA